MKKSATRTETPGIRSLSNPILRMLLSEMMKAWGSKKQPSTGPIPMLSFWFLLAMIEFNNARNGLPSNTR